MLSVMVFHIWQVAKVGMPILNIDNVLVRVDKLMADRLYRARRVTLFQEQKNALVRIGYLSQLLYESAHADNLIDQIPSPRGDKDFYRLKLLFSPLVMFDERLEWIGITHTELTNEFISMVGNSPEKLVAELLLGEIDASEMAPDSYVSLTNPTWDSLANALLVTEGEFSEFTGYSWYASDVWIFRVRILLLFGCIFGALLIISSIFTDRLNDIMERERLLSEHQLAVTRRQEAELAQINRRKSRIASRRSLIVRTSEKVTEEIEPPSWEEIQTEAIKLRARASALICQYPKLSHDLAERRDTISRHLDAIVSSKRRIRKNLAKRLWEEIISFERFIERYESQFSS